MNIAIGLSLVSQLGILALLWWLIGVVDRLEKQLTSNSLDKAEHILLHSGPPGPMRSRNIIAANECKIRGGQLIEPVVFKVEMDQPIRYVSFWDSRGNVLDCMKLDGYPNEWGDWVLENIL